MSTLAEPAARFAALGDPARLRLVVRLAGGASLSIARLSDDAGMSRQGVTKHLRVLEGAGLVRARREGREVRFALEQVAVAETADWLAAVGAQWDGALGRLKGFVERSPSP